MQVKGTGKGEVWPKVFKWQKKSAYKGDSKSRKVALFQRMYFMDVTLAKNSATSISAISCLC